jgi:hypothetical protein
MQLDMNVPIRKAESVFSSSGISKCLEGLNVWGLSVIDRFNVKEINMKYCLYNYYYYL